MPISKSVRFEIFARDGFICQYCGTRPPDVVLEVDHIYPVSKGGTDDLINLVTSCYDCNRGKSARELGKFQPRPDADLELLKVQQEHAEVARYLKAKRKRDAAIRKACCALGETWLKYLTPKSWPHDRVLVPWINRYGAEEVERAIVLTATPYSQGRFGWDEDRVFGKILPYIGAILRNRAIDKQVEGLQ
jgi:hypothetical protein